jgi:hypothetical protein
MVVMVVRVWQTAIEIAVGATSLFHLDRCMADAIPLTQETVDLV